MFSRRSTSVAMRPARHKVRYVRLARLSTPYSFDRKFGNVREQYLWPESW